MPGALGDYVANQEKALTVLAAGLNSSRPTVRTRPRRRRAGASKAEDRKPWTEKDEPEITGPANR